MRKIEPGYSIGHEMDFLEKLGAFATTQQSRQDLLANYLVGLAKRVSGFSLHDLNLIRRRATNELLKEA